MSIRYSTGVSVMLAGRVAVTVTFTSVTDEVPFAFVALTPNWYVPVAVVGVVLTVIADDALAVAADGVCVNGKVTRARPPADHDHLGVGLLGLVAVMVNELPAVIVCALDRVDRRRGRGLDGDGGRRRRGAARVVAPISER